ncbi:hypothetical protein HK103_004823 [Boothiomyces macroporosus]|uniref:Uncharacterized protein n=1 Tax=Boothiomyces macroporosus TaxID=261099 RepID=A0AAD5UGS0_9FUNG|nr:hypothetical protein HK103_004823 [Boothiomyces macroporosus]
MISNILPSNKYLDQIACETAGHHPHPPKIPKIPPPFHYGCSESFYPLHGHHPHCGLSGMESIVMNDYLGGFHGHHPYGYPGIGLFHGHHPHSCGYPGVGLLHPHSWMMQQSMNPMANWLQTPYGG